MSATMPYWRVLLYPFRGGAAIESINVAKMIPLDADGAVIGGSPTITGEQVYDDGSYPLSDTQTDVGTEYCVFDWQSGETAPAAIKFQYALPTAVNAFKVYFNSTDTVVGTRLASNQIYLLVQHSWDGTSWTTSGILGNVIASGNTNYEVYAHKQAILYAAGFDVPYSGPGGIYGVVSEDGVAAPGYPVVALQRDTFDKVAYTTTDTYGGYNLQGLNPDREYAVMAFDPTGVSPKNALIWDRVKPISAYTSLAPDNAFIAQRFRDPMLGPTLAIANTYPQYVGDNQYSEGFVQYAYGLGGLTGAHSNHIFSYNEARVYAGSQEQNIGILQSATIPGLAHMKRTDFASPQTCGNFFILFGGYHPDCPITAEDDYPANVNALTFELVLVPPSSTAGLVVEIGGGWTAGNYMSRANDYAMALWSYYLSTSSSPTRALALEFTSSTLKVHANLGAYNAATVLATASYTAGAEHHVVVTYEEGTALKVYIDGSLEATANLSGLGRLLCTGPGSTAGGSAVYELVDVSDYSNSSTYTTTSPSTSGNLWTGALAAVRSVSFRSFNYGSQHWQYKTHKTAFDGAVAWFATFFGVKDATAVGALYDSYADPTGYQVAPTQVGYSSQVEADNPSMYFPFSGTSWNGAKLLRSTLGRKDLGIEQLGIGTSLANSANFVGGKTALRFAGTSGLILRGGGALIAQAFSVEMFINPDSLGTAQTLIDVLNPTTTFRSFELSLNTSGNLVLGLFPAVTSVSARTLTPLAGPTCPASTATHIVVTCDPLDSGLLTVYKNGAQILQLATSQVHAANLAYNLYIGARYNATQPFAGLMGELAIYGYELSATRVAAHYAAIAA